MAKEADDKFKKKYADNLEKQFEDINHNDDEAEYHADEKWLISYADMMTLLFGLFVMLYAIAMETQGNPDKFFSDIAVGKNTLSELEHQIQEKERALAALKKELVNVNAQLSDKNKKLGEALTESDKNKALISQLQSELLQGKLQHAKLLEEMAKKGKRPDKALLAKLKQEEEAQAKALQDKAELDKKLLASTGEQQLLNQDLEHLKQVNSDNDQVIKELKGQMEDITAKNTGLNAKLQQLNEDAKSNNFMIIVLKWETEKHDLDLKVTDPSGQVYSFEQRTFIGNKAKFVLDSRSGPGVEMWETPQLEAGEYKIEFGFYNSYGNNKSALASGTIITRKGEFKIPAVSLDVKKAKNKFFTVKTNEAGNVIVQPLP